MNTTRKCCKDELPKGCPDCQKDDMFGDTCHAYQAYQQGRADAERDFQNSDEWNDYLAKVIADAKADAIEEVESKIISFHTDAIFRYGVDIIEARADAFDELKDWLKEQKWQSKI